MLRITDPMDRRHEVYEVRETELRGALQRERSAREARGAPRGRLSALLAGALRALASRLEGELEPTTARQPCT